jgi:hypothetical protein
MAFINQYSSNNGFKDHKISVYDLGDHTKVDSKYVVITDARNVAYFRTFATFNDSGSGEYTKCLPRIAPTDLQHFEFIDRLWVGLSRRDMVEYSDGEFDKVSALQQVVVLKNWWRIRIHKIIRQMRTILWRSRA